jgi:hypothetical protein
VGVIVESGSTVGAAVINNDQEGASISMLKNFLSFDADARHRSHATVRPLKVLQPPALVVVRAAD